MLQASTRWLAASGTSMALLVGLPVVLQVGQVMVPSMALAPMLQGALLVVRLVIQLMALPLVLQVVHPVVLLQAQLALVTKHPLPAADDHHRHPSAPSLAHHEHF